MSLQSNKGNQGPHLERLNEHLRRLQNDLQTCTASRHHILTGRGGQVQPECQYLPAMRACYTRISPALTSPMSPR